MLSAYLLSAVIGIMPPVVMKSPRVRPMSQTVREIVADAARRSPTITRLLEIIERSDTIVYIDLDFNLRSEGATTLIASNTLCRFVRVAVHSIGAVMWMRLPSGSSK